MSPRSTNVLLAVAVCAITLVTWAAWNLRPAAPAWSGQVKGYAYSPLRHGEDPADAPRPDDARVDSDLSLLADHALAVRTYTVRDGFARLPALAARHALSVTLGAWLDGDARGDRRELAELVRLSAQAANVERVMVGNETLLRRRLSFQQLADHLDRVRGRVDVPVSTAEPWHVWLQHPRLAQHVDVITAHLLPYWEGVPVEDAVDYLFSRLDQLRAAFPGKPVIIGEVGWPSRGARRGGAIPSPENQAAFIRGFLARANERDEDYFVMEAFDQPWKRAGEGEVGAYWGLFDASRRPRPVLGGPATLLSLPLPWPLLGLLAALLASGSYLLLSRDSADLDLPGRLWLAAGCPVLGSAVVWAVHDQCSRYWSAHEAFVGLLLGVAAAFMLLVTLVELHEWVESRWGRRWRSGIAVPRAVGAAPVLPMVSIHVPAHDEPPSMLADTLRALAALDYPHYEVLVVDNNTRDARRWKPIQRLCEELGPRFRFFHVEGLRGYKAGALNLALAHTAADARLVAVVDSDYQVCPEWLRNAVGYFWEPGVAIVQAPQDYRDTCASAFKSACAAEYATFFHSGMLTRNERNAIIQHGTMTVVRKRVLEAVGRWAEHTITEDAELGLRILAAGHDAVYLPISYGRGLCPDSFQDYKAQRHRWAFGAVQILRAHAGSLLWGRRGVLTRGQRYHFVAGWLPWIADGLNLAICVLALFWSALMLADPVAFPGPGAIYTLPVLVLFVLRLLKAVDLQRACVGSSLVRAVQGTLAGLSLTMSVGNAVLSAACGRDMPFLRTPKHAGGASIACALNSVRAEALLGGALALCATLLLPPEGDASGDAVAWCVLLSALAVPHLSAVALAVSATGAMRRGRCAAAADEAV